MPPYFTNRVRTNCQSDTIPVNSQLFTNQTAMTYTLIKVWQGAEDAGSITVLPALTYSSNFIENCSVSSIEIDFNALDRSANQIAFSKWGVSVRPFLTCSSDGGGGRTSFNLTTTYDYVPNTVPFSELLSFSGNGFLDRSKKRKAGLYWGESLMSIYWAFTSSVVDDIPPNANGEGFLRTGTISFKPSSSSTTRYNISSPDFFWLEYEFIVEWSQGLTQVLNANASGGRHNAEWSNGINAYPNVWIPSDSLAKSVYSTVLADLGQVNTSTILTDEGAPQHFTSNFSQMLGSIHDVVPGPLTKDFDTLKSSTGPLGLTPSMLRATYICQVPQLKSAGDLFLAVLIADLVIL